MTADTPPALPPDPALWRGLTQRRASRRDFLSGASLLGASALLAGCGIPGSASRNKDNINWKQYWSRQKVTGTLDFANWPLYIDSDHGHSKALELFTKATGIKVNYLPVIQGDAPFYATVEPQLAAQESTGYDIAVMTNGWSFTEMVNSNFLVELDHSRLPNFDKYASPLVRNPNYDPHNRFSAVWQTGFTGIAYNTQYIKREITSFQDLADPAFRGYVGMMNDTTELGNAGLLATGVAPGDSTPSDWANAAKWLKDQRPNVAGYYDQSYIQHLENGDTWITQAWSGDVFQANLSGYPHLKFVVPKEGIITWHDNMVILRQAAHPLDALEWMNFYYTPKIAGIVEDWVNYVCPVPGAQEYIRTVLGDATVANSPLVFPTDAMNALAHDYYVFKDFDQYQQWNTLFNAVIES